MVTCILKVHYQPSGDYWLTAHVYACRLGPGPRRPPATASMHAVWAEGPCGLPLPLTGYGPREAALSHHYAAALAPGPWSALASRRPAPCTPTYFRSSSAMQASLSPCSFISSSPLRFLASRVLVGHTSARSGSACRLAPCPRPSPARVLCRLDLVLMVSWWYALVGARPRTRRSRSPSAPRAPVLERPHSLPR